MPYDIPVILIPLIGGYLILSKSIFFIFRYKRLSSQRLVFDSIIAGFVLFLVTYFIRVVVFYLLPFLYEFIENIINTIPYHTPLIGTSLFSFLFAIIFIYPTNYIYSEWFRKKEHRIFVNIIYNLGDELEQLFFESSVYRKNILITLKNYKVYVGIVTKVKEPKKTNYIKIFPIISGYRKPVSKKIEFTTPYQQVVESAINKNDNLSYKDFLVIIKQDEILTASFFEPEIYEKLHSDSANVKNQ